jgi:hypothetical protein
MTDSPSARQSRPPRGSAALPAAGGHAAQRPRLAGLGQHDARFAAQNEQEGKQMHMQHFLQSMPAVEAPQPWGTAD